MAIAISAVVTVVLGILFGALYREFRDAGFSRLWLLLVGPVGIAMAVAAWTDHGVLVAIPVGVLSGLIMLALAAINSSEREYLEEQTRSMLDNHPQIRERFEGSRLFGWRVRQIMKRDARNRP